MSPSISRRRFVQLAGAATGAAYLGLPETSWAGGKATVNAEKLGWRLGCQAYSFNKFTFFEAVDKVASIGLGFIEAYPGQKLSPAKPDVKVNHDTTPAQRAEIKKKLADSGVTLVNFGVVGLPAKEADCRKIFDFAKDMGIETIVSEPGPDAIDLLDKLADEYKINVALHNHPEPSRYWNPDTVLATCKGRSKRLGACADTGHWMRSGMNPLDCLKKLEGRIISFHFKDLNKYGKQGAHDVPWGTGKADAKALLAEIRRQKFQGTFSIEYEHNWLESLPEIKQCVDFFEKTATELS